MKVITIEKGGVGKATPAINLAGTFAKDARIAIPATHSDQPITHAPAFSQT